MAELDKLSIKISADAGAANRSLNSLAKNIEKVSASLGSLNTGGLNEFSSGIRSLSSSLSEFKGSSKEAEKFKTIAAGLRKFTNIKAEELNKVSSAIEPLARGISAFNSITFDSKSVTSFINSITRLSRADLGGLANADFAGIGDKIAGLSNSLSGAATIDSKTQSLVNSITRLANAGEKSTAVKANLPAIRSEVRAFVKDMARAPVAAKETTQIVQAIAQLASAGGRSETTAKNLNILAIKTKNFIRVLSTAPEVSKGTVQLVTAIGQIASAGSRANSAFNGIANSGNRNVSVMSKLGSALKKLIPGLNRTNKSSKGLASSFGMFYAKFFLIIRAIKSLGGAIGSAQDYIEDFNYFSVALDKIGKDSASQFREAGYDSAEEYADSFRGRFGKLQKQMTGYTVDTDTGALSKGMDKNLGLDISQVMSFQGAIAQITNSAGMLGETSIMTSEALSMLSADWSSLSNTALPDVMKNMQSALIGQSRAVYKYGIDITSAGLAQTAMNHGLNVSVKNLSQASKMQLRLLTILEQSKVAYGDLARTINQPANQLRMLQAGFKNLARSIGAVFLPIIQKIYPYLNAIVIVLQEFVDWIAKLTGADLSSLDGGISTPDLGYDDAADDSADMADNTKKAAKESKKLSDNLQGFDIINKLSENDNTDTGTGGTPNAGTQNLDLSGNIESALNNYKKIWDKAFKDSNNKAVKLAEKIKKALLSGWEKGDFTELGKKLANWIVKALKNIPWGEIKETLNKMAKSIATFLNGFLGDETLWGTVGDTLAEAFNTVVSTLYTFVTTIQWLQIGENLATGINRGIKKADFKLAGKTLGASLRGIIKMAFGTLTNIEYNTIGQKIADFINGFLEDMGAIDEKTGLSGWQELGKSISDGAKGILDTINTALSGIKWDEVGKAIADFLTSIDWWGLFGKLLETLKTVFTSILKAAVSAFSENPAGVIKALTGAIALVFTVKKLISSLGFLKNIFKSVFGKKITEGIGDAKIDTGAIKTGKIGKGLSKAGKAFGKIFAFYAAAEIIVSVTKAVGDGLKNMGDKNSSNIGEYAAYAVGDSLGFASDSIDKLLSLDFAGFGDNVGELWSGLKGSKAGGDITSKNVDNIIKNSGKYADSLKEAQKEMEKFGISSSEMYFGLKKIKKAFDGGKITSKELTKVLKKQHNGYSDLMTDIGVDGVRKTERFNEQQNKLKNTMEKLGVPSGKQSEIISKLNDYLDKGSITWGQYKEITDGSYMSVGKLSSAIKKLSPKSVKVEAKVDGKNDVKDTKNAVDGIKSKEITIKAKTSGIQTLKDLKDAIGNMSNKDISLTISPKLRKDWYKEWEKQFGKIVKKQHKGETKKNKADDTSLWAAAVKKKKAKGYYTGGHPPNGQLFWANERGAELIGKMNGQTTVAPQDDIASGFATAITSTLAPVMYSAFRQAALETVDKNGGDVYLDGQKITKNVIGHINNMSKSAGNSPIWGVS